MNHNPAVLRADAIRALAARWLPCLGDGDFVVSPAGLWLALGAVASGARGRTGEELGALLGVEGEAAGEAVTAVGRRIAAAGGVVMATGVWSRVPVLEGFRRGLPGVGFGVLPGDGQAELDAWVRESTGGRIDGLPLRLDGSEDLVLLNALALKASWRTAFRADLTRDEPFTDGDGTTRPVPTMRQRIPAAQVWYVDGVTVVELPCAGEAGALVRFVLGPEGAGPAEVLPAAWASARERLAADSVDLALPRFESRTRTGADAHLKALGVTRALRPGAEFPALSDAELFVSEVVQEVMIEVAEEGVEAAAVTQVTMTRSAARPPRPVVERIAFDRPFGVVVLDATGELPLFTGWQRSAPVAGKAVRGRPDDHR
ncbi:serpin family protein [Streptomyces sp. SR27]|uniref:serpin family protein n=1 Tax=unclassified Streptomyces TaxID=2593676 RepID=UPI00295B2912|nr:serpin family protein [Streptomyces sp. SR27]MDV9193192.1 serpin family protein [Streptomyces sp. SR27]